MKRWKYICFILIALITMSACYFIKGIITTHLQVMQDNQTNKEQIGSELINIEEINKEQIRNKQFTKEKLEQKSSEQINKENKEQISNKEYKKDGIEANYPEFVSGGTEDSRNKWNKIIYDDFNKILKLYAFNPFPELTPVPSAIVPVILKISYDIKSNNNQFVSILYTAAFNSPYSAHPTELVYTTNVDKINNKRVKLSDLIELNSDFVKDFKQWDFIPYEKGNEELNQAIRDYISNMSDEDLLMGFRAADQIGSENLLDIYSYLTQEHFGISIGVPNYIGDHVEFERDYSDLKKYLKPDYIW